MQRLYSFFFSKIFKKKVYNEYGDCIGSLYDMLVMNEDGYPKIVGYKIKDSREITTCLFRTIDFLKDNDGKIMIKVKGQRDIIPNSYSYLIRKNLLGKQIVDVNGKKMVRANDVRLASIAGELKIVAVDPGFKGYARTHGFYKLLKFFYKIKKDMPDDRLIMWDNVEPLEVGSGNLKLNVPYKKLSKLHPADLADILEDVDADYRSKIFASLDENLAADTLEEIEPEYQKEILGYLVGDRRNTVLSNIPNDELADMLEEVDDETAEKILTDLEEEDAEEIRELMEYKENSIGSIMNKDFLTFSKDDKVSDVIERIKEINPEDEVSYYIYVIDLNENLLGVVSFKSLIFSSREDTLEAIMLKDLLCLKDSDSVNEAIGIIEKYNLLAIPVIDEESRLCGVVVVHDIIEGLVHSRHLRKS